MENALEMAEESYVDVNIFNDENKERLRQLNALPVSCTESAELLSKQCDVYCKYDVFTQSMINGIVKKLKSYNDQSLREEIADYKSKILELVNRYINCG